MEWNRMKSRFAEKMDYFVLKIDIILSKISWSYHENRAIEELNSIAQENDTKIHFSYSYFVFEDVNLPPASFFSIKMLFLLLNFLRKKIFSLSRPQRK